MRSHSSISYLDAHNHLHDARLDPTRDEMFAALHTLPLTAAIVNGTREGDWDDVRRLASAHRWAIPAYGLHPWFGAERSPSWLCRLAQLLDEDSRATVGEVGLDRWINDYDLPRQQTVFRAQLQLAADRERPITIHCLRAWGALLETLREAPLPACGFLLHAYGGAGEMVPELVALGAYFSFSPAFLDPAKTQIRAAFQNIPADRLLVETDAPDMPPPPGQNPRPLGSESAPLNHPANLDLAYAGLAELRGQTVTVLADQVAQNFLRLFGRDRMLPL